MLPILTYPAYSLNSISNTDTLTLQRMQNKALRFATRDENTTYTTEELHINTNTQPINIKLHNRGQNTKSKLVNTLQDETYIQLTTNNENTNQHNWFRKPILHISKPPPEPKYT